MGLSLLDHVAGYDVLLIVDAVQTGRAPIGFVHEIDGDDLKVLPTLSPHFLGIAETLALGRQLGLDMPAKVKILAVEVTDPFTVSETLSPVLECALPEILKRIVAAIAKAARVPG